MVDVDVLIIGAGLSGVGAACHLQRECPEKSVLILETRESMGGTWDLFRYPGIRSDSDMYTLGYDFKPWTESQAIADGASILNYIRETAAEYGVEAKIRYQHRVRSAEFSSETAQWSVLVERGDTGELLTITCSFLYACSGYYRYDEGYTPQFPGLENFAGQIVHPQHWPAELDYAGQRVVVIGSGATAVTLVPTLAAEAGHVTMLQRSPTYITSLPARDPLAEKLRSRLSPARAYSIVRWKNVLVTMASYQLSRRRPEVMKKLLRKAAIRQLPPGYDVDVHFKPKYNPWDQRLCVVPNGDLFRALRKGTASIVTDQIESFTADGIRLASGEFLPADIVITATGLNVLALGGATLRVDGVDVDLSASLAYRGMMLSGIPNFALTIGYTNASWTLKADLVARYVCRLLNYMSSHNYAVATPVAPTVTDPAQLRPLIDLESGYVQRGMAAWPKQGPVAPWRLHQNYLRDIRLMKRSSVADEMEFRTAPTRRTSTNLVP